MEEFVFNLTAVVFGFIGFITYQFWLLTRAKDPLDLEGKAFNLRWYWQTNWDNIGLSFLLTVIWVLGGPQFIQFESGAKWFDALYLLAPIFIQKAIEQLNKK